VWREKGKLVKFTISTRNAMMSLVAALTMTIATVGQQQTTQHRHYKVLAIGTFGGLTSSFNVGDDEGVFSSNIVNMKEPAPAGQTAQYLIPFKTSAFFDCSINRALRLRSRCDGASLMPAEAAG
jgi:hypothetical protein